MSLKLSLTMAAALIVLAGCTSTAPHRTAAVQKYPCPTASHLPQGAAPCAAGRTYSGADLDRTGEINPGDALQKLDPSIVIERH